MRTEHRCSASRVAHSHGQATLSFASSISRRGGCRPTRPGRWLQIDSRSTRAMRARTRQDSPPRPPRRQAQGGGYRCKWCLTISGWDRSDRRACRGASMPGRIWRRGSMRLGVSDSSEMIPEPGYAPDAQGSSRVPFPPRPGTVANTIGNRLGRLLRGQRSCRWRRKYHTRLACHQSLGKLAQRARLIIGIDPVEDNVLSFEPAEGSDPIVEGLESDPRPLACVLGASTPTRRRVPTRRLGQSQHRLPQHDHRDKGASLGHWSTSPNRSIHALRKSFGSVGPFS